jgi:hypothetical protein
MAELRRAAGCIAKEQGKGASYDMVQPSTNFIYLSSAPLSTAMQRAFALHELLFSSAARLQKPV